MTEPEPKPAFDRRPGVFEYEDKEARWICPYCLTKGRSVLCNQHPFITGETIHGCRACGEIGLERLCDVEGCNQLAHAGTPTVDGYRFHCGRHEPEKGEE
jgi:hypothetical protein